MNVFIRTDASVAIGSGHVMRCLALAEQLKKSMGANVTFISRAEEGHMNRWIEHLGYDVCPITSKEWDWKKDLIETEHIISLSGMNADWLVIDHYMLDEHWESGARRIAGKILVIDDLANRQHDCDILVDQNLYDEMENRYNNIVPSSCIQLLGPAYTFLRYEFYKARRTLRVRDGIVRKILVFLGGSDPNNTTLKVLRSLSNIKLQDKQVVVVVGASNPNKEQIRAFCIASSGFHYHYQVENMAELIAEADLAIGAGGITIWERCFLGLPTLTVIQVENQRLSTETVAAYGALWNLGWDEHLMELELAKRIEETLEKPYMLSEVSELGLRLMGDPEWHGIPRILEHMK